jgi:hypothetical protein
MPPEPCSILPSLNTAVLSCQIFSRVLVYKDYQLLKICKVLEYKLLARPSTTIPPPDNYGLLFSSGRLALRLVLYLFSAATRTRARARPRPRRRPPDQILAACHFHYCRPCPTARNTSTTSAQAKPVLQAPSTVLLCSALPCPLHRFLRNNLDRPARGVLPSSNGLLPVWCMMLDDQFYPPYPSISHLTIPASFPSLPRHIVHCSCLLFD